MFPDNRDSSFLYFLQATVALRHGNFPLAMESYMRAKDLLAYYHVFTDLILKDFIKHFCWERIRIPSMPGDLDPPELEALKEMAAKIEDCAQMHHHF